MWPVWIGKGLKTYVGISVGPYSFWRWVVSDLRKPKACTETSAKKTKLDLKSTLQKSPSNVKSLWQMCLSDNGELSHTQGSRKALWIQEWFHHNACELIQRTVLQSYDVQAISKTFPRIRASIPPHFCSPRPCTPKRGLCQCRESGFPRMEECTMQSTEANVTTALLCPHHIMSMDLACFFKSNLWG